MDLTKLEIPDGHVVLDKALLAAGFTGKGHFLYAVLPFIDLSLQFPSLSLTIHRRFPCLHLTFRTPVPADFISVHCPSALRYRKPDESTPEAVPKWAYAGDYGAATAPQAGASPLYAAQATVGGCLRCFLRLFPNCPACVLNCLCSVATVTTLLSLTRPSLGPGVEYVSCLHVESSCKAVRPPPCRAQRFAVNGRRSGVGTMRAASGASYYGQWVDNLYSGKGALSYPDGSAHLLAHRLSFMFSLLFFDLPPLFFDLPPLFFDLPPLFIDLPLTSLRQKRGALLFICKLHGKAVF